MHQIECWRDDFSKETKIAILDFKKKIDKDLKKLDYKVLKAPCIQYSPDVSVIVPVFNVEQYINECMDSIVNQTYKNIEIICINDGSTDDSLKTILEYAENDSRITICNQSNKGLSVARNIGIDLARGKYIIFCDSDDYLLGNTVSNLYSRIEKENLDMLCFGIKPFDDDCEALDKVYKNFLEFYKIKGKYDGIYQGKELFLNLVSNNDYLSSAVVRMYKKSFLNEYRIRFIPGYLYEDNSFTFEAFMQAKNVGYDTKEYYMRRVRCSSIITSEKKFYNVYSMINMARCMFEKLSSFELDKKTYDVAYHLISGIVEAGYNIYEELNISERNVVYALDAVNRSYIEGMVGELSVKHNLYNKIIKLCILENKLSKYVCYHKIDTVILHGLGKYGDLMFKVLKFLDIRIIAGVDRQVTSFKDIKVLDDLSILPECDMIIISIVNPPNSIIESYKNKGINNVITIESLIKKIEYFDV